MAKQYGNSETFPNSSVIKHQGYGNDDSNCMGSVKDISHIGRHLDVDPGILRAVTVLRAQGVETFESCEGGNGHASPEPVVKFHGGFSAGWRALAIAIENGLPVCDLRRTWQMEDGEPAGPFWEMTFLEKMSL